MPLAKELVSSGLHSSQAAALGGSIETGIIAAATQTQAAATQLTRANNVIGTCAVANDGVKAPYAEVGDTIFIRNGGAAVAKVYPPSGGSINGGNADEATTLAAGASVVLRYTSTKDMVS